MNVRAQRAVSNVIKVLDSISTPAGASSNSSVWIDLVGDKDNSYIYKLKNFTSGNFSSAYFQPAIMSTKGLPPQSSVILSVNSKDQSGKRWRDETQKACPGQT